MAGLANIAVDEIEVGIDCEMLVGLAVVEELFDAVLDGIFVVCADTVVGEALVGRLATGVMIGKGLRVVDVLIIYLFANAPSVRFPHLFHKGKNFSSTQIIFFF